MFMHVLIYFFFKQKTAYEMRISDWSSDVCSSDLRKGLQGRAHPNLQVVLYPCSHIIAGAPGHDEPVISPDQVFSVCSGINQQQCSANIPVAVPCTHNGHAGSANGAHGGGKIGGASWRERVCQYV